MKSYFNVDMALVVLLGSHSAPSPLYDLVILGAGPGAAANATIVVEDLSKDARWGAWVHGTNCICCWSSVLVLLFCLPQLPGSCRYHVLCLTCKRTEGVAAQRLRELHWLQVQGQPICERPARAALLGWGALGEASLVLLRPCLTLSPPPNRLFESSMRATRLSRLSSTASWAAQFHPNALPSESCGKRMSCTSRPIPRPAVPMLCPAG